MKKVLFLMIAALSAGFASAVTTTWSNFNTTSTVASATAANYTNAQPLNIYMAAILTATTTPTYTLNSITIARRTDGSDATPAYIAIVNAAGTEVARVATTTSTETITVGTSSTAQGSFTATFADLVLNTAENYRIYGLATVDDSTSNALRYGFTVVQNPLSDVVSTSATTAWDPAMSITYTVADVPEPTMLALIALGVAGLALKRRA